MMFGAMMSGMFMGLMGMMSFIGPAIMMLMSSMFGPMAQILGLTAAQ